MEENEKPFEPWNDDWPQTEYGPEHFWWAQRSLTLRRKYYPRIALRAEDFSEELISSIANAEYPYHSWIRQEEAWKAAGNEYSDEYLEFIAELTQYFNARPKDR